MLCSLPSNDSPLPPNDDQSTSDTAATSGIVPLSNNIHDRLPTFSDAWMRLLPSTTTDPPFPPPSHGSPPLVPITFARLSIVLNASQASAISGTAPPSNDVYPPCLSPSHNSLQPLTAVRRLSLLWRCPEPLFQSLLRLIMIMPPAGM